MKELLRNNRRYSPSKIERGTKVAEKEKHLAHR